MSLQSHLSELERKHQSLEKEIAAEQQAPSQDETKLHALKKKKLHLKEEIERLRAEPTRH